MPDQPDEETCRAAWNKRALFEEALKALEGRVSEFKSPRQILDGEFLAEDLGILIGYVWAEGNQQREFPSEHFTALAEYFEKKWGNEQASGGGGW